MMVKKIILILISLSIVSASILAPVIKAQETPESWYNSSYASWKDKVFKSPDGEIFGERYTFAQIQWILYSLVSLAAGTNMLDCAEKAVSQSDEFESCAEGLMGVGDNTTSSVGSGSVIGLAALVDSISSVKIASGIDYLASSASKLHLIPEASAQGFGFQTLLPVQQMWRAFRNMAYLLSIVVILIISFMIMFRLKLNPQTVITVQSALPKLISVLILITFSYAIAGLMIDFSYLVIALVTMLAKSNGLIGGSEFGNPATSLEIAARMWEGAFWPLSSLLTLVMIPIIILLALGFAAAGGLGLSIPIVGAIGGMLGVLMGVIMLLLLIIFIVITLLKILFMMIKTTITIILLIIFGPLIILAGAFSSGVGGFGMWAKLLLSNIAVFPTLAIMGFLGHLIFWVSSHPVYDMYGIRDGKVFNPFQVNNLMGGFAGNYMDLPIFQPGVTTFAIIGSLGIIFMMPKAAELIKNLIQGRPAPGTAIGEVWGTMAGGFGAASRFGPVQAMRGLGADEGAMSALDFVSTRWGEHDPKSVRGKIASYTSQASKKIGSKYEPRP